MSEQEQLDFPFTLDHAAVRTFLARWMALEDEQARLREDMRLLKEDYKEQVPMRPLLTAVKVWRARATLADHPKEPLSLPHQGVMEAIVETHLHALDAERRQLAEELGEG